MSDPPDLEPGPADDVDASVESRAARARGATSPSAPGDATGPTGSAQRARAPVRAWVLALAADAVQWAIVPLFGPGIASPADVVLDLIVGALLVRWCGWHWVFLPTVVAELIPGVDLVPTWTAAVWFVTWTGRGGRRSA